MIDNDMNYVKGFDLFGVKARQIPCLTGKGEPIESIALKIGLLYINEDNGDMYKCVKRNGEEGLVWEMIGTAQPNGDGSIDTEDLNLGESLFIEDGKLLVKTTDKMEQDNTLPISSAGVFQIVGNIQALLETI